MELNLARLADESLERLGDRPSLYFEGQWHSSGQLHDRAARIASGLLAQGIRPGDRIIVMMTNCAEVTLVYSAAWRVGAVVTPVIFLLSAPELKHVLEDSGAALVVTSPELVPKLNESLDGRSLPVFVVGDNFAELEAHEPAAIVDRAPDDLAALLYTGGTTGRSKGVALTHANLSHAGASSRKVSHVPGIVRGIGALPLSHSFGLLVTVGGYHTPEPTSSVLQRWFDPASFLALAAEHRSQTAPMVPSMIVMLLALPLEEYDLSELRFIYSGAAPLARSVAEEFERRVPGVRVLEGYGCTETAGILTGSPPLSPRRGTVGQPVPNVELKIVGLDGAEVPTGEDGEIIARGPNVMAGYWRSDDVLGDGWFHTGDIGHLDADGYLTIVDRMKDLIIRNGYNVYPRDIEDALLEHPAVSMAAVVGRVDPRVGEEVVAFVSLTVGAALTEEELLAYAKERIAANKYPREIHIVDAIPLTSVGKLDRKRLRARVREAVGEVVASEAP